MPRYSKPNNCAYVFNRGKRKGETCNRPAKNDKCYRHSEHKLSYKRNYYQKRKDNWRSIYPNLYVEKTR